MHDSDYVPPPPFAPPPLRVAPLNETAVLGRTSYPHGPYLYESYEYPQPYGAYAQPPVAWYPPAAYSPTAWQPRQLDGTARRRRTVSIVTAMAVIAALVAICAVLLSNSPSRRARSLSLPGSVDNYTKVTTLNAAQIRTMFAGGGILGGMQSRDLETARIGVYAALDDDDPTLLFIGFTGQDSPTIGAQLRADPAGTVAEQVLSGAGASSGQTTADAGPLGGAMRCAIVDLDGDSASVAVWADDDTLGIVLIVDPAISTRAGATTAHTSSVTRDFRAKAEH